MVEDQTLIAMALETDLRDHGLEVAGRAATVDAALAMIDRDPPDLAVLDVNLAGADAMPVAERLHDRAIPFVFATGYGLDFVRPGRLSGVPVVGKPYRIADVLARLAEAERQGTAPAA